MRRPRIKSLVLIPLLFFFTWFAAELSLAQEKPAQRLVLANGLTVVLKELHTAPVVALNLWVKAGSLTETDDQAGISHLFEHMLFKGTKKREVGQIAREIESLGGDINAFTSMDYTGYYIILASRHLEEGLDILADAAFSSAFDPDELAREKEVVLEEWRRGEDQPGERLSKKLFATVFSKHPYRRPVIGYEDTIRSLTREQMLAYFEKWYRPDNMVLAIAGDFDSEKIKAALAETFGRYPSRQRVSPPQVVEPEQKETKAFVMREKAKEARVELAFRIPSVTDPDVPALDLLATVLGQGESSRLYRQVKDEKGLVYSTSADSFTPSGPGLFSVDARLDPSRLKPAIRELLKETFRFKYDPVTSAELEKAKLQIVSEAVYSKETMQGLARKLAYFEIQYGDFNKEEDYYRAVDEATAQDLMAVTAKYLTLPRLIAGVLIPEDSQQEIREEELMALAQEAQKEVEGYYQAQTAKVEGIVRKVLKNGLTLLIKENRGVPTVAVRAAVLAGTRYETDENNGINNLISLMLTKGTKTRDAAAIATEVETMAASVSGFSGQNSLGVTGQFLSQYFRSGLALVADLILNSSFPQSELDKARKDVLAAIRRREERLSRLAFYHLGRTLYKVHPYGLDPLGTEASLARLTSQQLAEYKQKFVTPGNMVLAVVGDVQADEVASLVEEEFASFLGPTLTPPPVPQEPPLRERRQTEVNKDSQQVHIIVAFSGTTIKSEDRFSLEVLAGVLSGQGGRLFIELRDRRPLAYSVYAFSQEGLEPGSFGVYMATAPGKAKEALDGIKAELDRIRSRPVSPEELKRATNNIAGGFEIGLQRNSSLAASLAFNQLYGLGYDFYRHYPERILNVTAEEVLAAARKYIDLDKYVLILVGPAGARQ